MSINPEKPRKGTFAVTVGESVVTSLVGMPRPFKPLRELDIDALAEKVRRPLLAPTSRSRDPILSRSLSRSLSHCPFHVPRTRLLFRSSAERKQRTSAPRQSTDPGSHPVARS